MKIRHWLGALTFIILCWFNARLFTPTPPARGGWAMGTQHAAHVAEYWR